MELLQLQKISNSYFSLGSVLAVIVIVSISGFYLLTSKEKPKSELRTIAYKDLEIISQNNVDESYGEPDIQYFKVGIRQTGKVSIPGSFPSAQQQEFEYFTKYEFLNTIKLASEGDTISPIVAYPEIDYGITGYSRVLVGFDEKSSLGKQLILSGLPFEQSIKIDPRS